MPLWSSTDILLSSTETLFSATGGDLVMALENLDLHGALATYGPGLRFAPFSALRTFKVKTGTAITFTPGTAFVYDTISSTAQVRPWLDVDDDSATIADRLYPTLFLWPRPVLRSATGEVLATFMVDGRFNINDVPFLSDGDVAITGLTEAALLAALKHPELRRMGFFPEGAAGIA